MQLFAILDYLLSCLPVYDRICVFSACFQCGNYLGVIMYYTADWPLLKWTICVFPSFVVCVSCSDWFPLSLMWSVSWWSHVYILLSCSGIRADICGQCRVGTLIFLVSVWYRKQLGVIVLIVYGSVGRLSTGTRFINFTGTPLITSSILTIDLFFFFFPFSLFILQRNYLHHCDKFAFCTLYCCKNLLNYMDCLRWCIYD